MQDEKAMRRSALEEQFGVDFGKPGEVSLLPVRLGGPAGLYG